MCIRDQFVQDHPDVRRMRAKVGAEGLPVDELHDEKTRAVVCATIIKNFGKMGMVEGAQDAELVLEARDDLFLGGTTPTGSGSPVLGLEHLGRAHGTGAQVADAKHGRGRTLAERRDHFIAVSYTHLTLPTSDL